MKLINIFTKKIEVMDWNEYHDYIELLAINQFQQQTRRQSIKNSGVLKWITTKNHKKTKKTKKTNTTRLLIMLFVVVWLKMKINKYHWLVFVFIGIVGCTLIDTTVFYQRDFISYLFINIFEWFVFVIGVVFARLFSVVADNV